MIRLILFIVFMIPISFSNKFWLNYLIYNILIFIGLIKFSSYYYYSNIRILYGIDILSSIIVILTIWICSLIILARKNIYRKNLYPNLFKFNLLILILSLIMTFISINFFLFYVFFEIRLIPTLILIIGWGYQPERIQARIYLLFYTMLGSLPILFSILFYYYCNKRLIICFINLNINSFILFLCIIIVFLVKIPMFFVHLWLPKAHVESPISGSIILAGIILKLGGYGLIRVLPIFSKINYIYNYIFIRISLMGGFFISLICLRQRDIKSLVAYSSVAHIGIVIGGLITLSNWGITGSLAIIIAHGLCSSGLFCLVNINYERIFSRRLFLNKGFINILPRLSLIWFLLCSSNIAAPPSLNLLSEIFLINRIIAWENSTILFLILISFFRAAYSLFLYSYTQHGKFFSGSFFLNFSNIREFLLLIIHWLPLNLLFLKSEFNTLWLYLNSLKKILICGIKVINLFWVITICYIYFLTFLLLRIYTFTLRVNFIIKDYSIIVEYVLINMNSSNIRGIILLDWISLLFIRFVLFISSIVIFYREEYIEGDLNLNRFIILVVIFVLSIILLIIRPNIIRILLGWDGLGLISYCLVVYYQNIKSFNAGIITALRNRVGDVIILISIAWILNFGRWNFIFYFDFIKDDTRMNILSWLVIIAAFTKRAQIPFSSWLPAAIAAPTPVSSLVHSRTLVTAGVYLLIRFRSRFNIQIITIILFICSITIFIAGLGANFEFDLKKIIALSTLRQLGLIIRILFLGDYKLAFFHLLTHALFKALLFICAGNIIHRLLGCQDIRFIGSLINLIPLTCCLFCIANLSLCGIPFLSRFYSKDLILESFCIQRFNIYIYIIFFVSTGLTTRYTIRLLYYLLLGNFNFISLNSLRENRKIILTGMRGLFTFVIIIGSILSWLIIDIPYLINLPFMIKISTLIVIIIGSIIGYEISKFSLYYSSKTINFYKSRIFSSLIWNLPIMSTGIILKLPLILGFIYKKLFDQGWTEFIGSQGIYLILKKNSSLLQIIHFNHLKIFFIITVILMFIFIILYLYSLYKSIILKILRKH